jgi:hypothetical protein
MREAYPPLPYVFYQTPAIHPFVRRFFYSLMHVSLKSDVNKGTAFSLKSTWRYESRTPRKDLSKHCTAELWHNRRLSEQNLHLPSRQAFSFASFRFSLLLISQTVKESGTCWYAPFCVMNVTHVVSYLIRYMASTSDPHVHRNAISSSEVCATCCVVIHEVKLLAEDF